MALKDWRKSRAKGPTMKGTFHIRWNKKNTKEFLIINKYMGKREDKYHVLLYDKKRQFEDIWDKSFKTKQQALKYAKAYMRKH